MNVVRSPFPDIEIPENIHATDFILERIKNADPRRAAFVSLTHGLHDSVRLNISVWYQQC